MQELKSWIEAQLKKGYRKEQIKRALIKKGYPQKAVAELDKIAYTAPSAKTLPSKKINKKISSKTIASISIVIGIVFLVWLFNAMPFFSKQVSEDIAKQKSIEQMREEEAEASMNEKDIEKLQELEAREKNKEEFDSNFCTTLIPENLRNTKVKEYTLNYHIDGSFGENVKWSASEQPKEEFSPFEGPQVFFVSGNEFEGCGYKEEIINKEIVNELKDKLGLPSLCNGKQIHIIKASYEFHNRINLYLIEPEEKIIRLTIFVISEFGDKEQISTSLGCGI